MADPWHCWTHLSTLASDVSDALGLVLELPSNLPDEYVIARWLSEPVVCVLLRTDIFLTNAKGHPVLPMRHQRVLRRFFKINVQVMISGPCRQDRGIIAYQKFITWLWKNQSGPDLYEKQSKGFEDQLQEPLQPLRDNLSSTTYGIFEMDPYKYNAYETAIYEALLQRMTVATKRQNIPNGTGREDSAGDGPCVPRKKSNSPYQVIMVLGAGRGPLVNAALMAAERAKCPVRVYAVEKNPNALYTLQDRMNQEWRDHDVKLVGGDMRQLTLPDKADIFVSELLGSFADNELSPECLDGAQAHLKDDGISIPCSYTSFLAPIQSLRFHNETKRPRDPNVTSRSSLSQETPFVVRLLHSQVLAAPQEFATFYHPKPGTHPDRHSLEMVSWFPMAFPLDHAVPVRAGENVTVHMWRSVDTRHVWYEWALSEPYPTRIHNGAGVAYKITL